MFSSRRILTFLTLASFLLTSFAASVHVHVPVTKSDDGVSQTANCSCLDHFELDQDSESPASPQHDPDHCLVCKFIAESSIHVIADGDFELQQLLSGRLFLDDDVIVVASLWAYHGRAPPV